VELARAQLAQHRPTDAIATLRLAYQASLDGMGRYAPRSEMDLLMAQAFAAALVRRPRQFYRDGLQVLRRHQAAGDRVIVVTGCERTVARGILDQLGLEGLELQASEFKPGPFGMRVKFHNVGRRKLERLAAHGVKEWQLAYSDSLADIPMLKGAGEAVLVNGTPKVCKRLEKVLGRSVTRVEWF